MLRSTELDWVTVRSHDLPVVQMEMGSSRVQLKPTQCHRVKHDLFSWGWCEWCIQLFQLCEPPLNNTFLADALTFYFCMLVMLNRAICYHTDISRSGKKRIRDNKSMIECTSNLSTQSSAWQEFSSLMPQWKKNYLYLILNVRHCSSALAVSVKAFATTATANIKRKIHHHHHLTMFQGWCNVGKCQKFVPAFRQKVCFTRGLERLDEQKVKMS